jgi:hypothetical protein
MAHPLGTPSSMNKLETLTTNTAVKRFLAGLVIQKNMQHHTKLLYTKPNAVEIVNKIIILSLVVAILNNSLFFSLLF